MAQGVSSADPPLSTIYPARRRLRLASGPMAWVISITIHAALFAVLLRVVYPEPVVAARRLIIPEARLAPGDETMGPVKESSGASPRPADSVRPQEPAVENHAQPVPVEISMPDVLPIVAAPSANASAATSFTSAAVLPTYSSRAGGVTGRGGGGAGGAMGVAGPATSFFGQGGNAYKVVYVVDASASLMIYIDEVVRQMRKSIRDLVPTQEFHIVLAKPGRVEQMEPPRLLPAIDRYKKTAGTFLDSMVGVPQPGKADPIEAMRRAFALRPELIYFLTDGDYRDLQDDLEKTLTELNPRGEVHITTIGFDPSPAPSQLLERIAKRHGGHFRIIQFKE